MKNKKIINKIEKKNQVKKKTKKQKTKKLEGESFGDKKFFTIYFGT